MAICESGAKKERETNLSLLFSSSSSCPLCPCTTKIQKKRIDFSAFRTTHDSPPPTSKKRSENGKKEIKEEERFKQDPSLRIIHGGFIWKCYLSLVVSRLFLHYFIRENDRCSFFFLSEQTEIVIRAVSTLGAGGRLKNPEHLASVEKRAIRG